MNKKAATEETLQTGEAVAAGRVLWGGNDPNVGHGQCGLSLVNMMMLEMREGLGWVETCRPEFEFCF